MMASFPKLVKKKASNVGTLIKTSRVSYEVLNRKREFRTRGFLIRFLHCMSVVQAYRVAF